MRKSTPAISLAMAWKAPPRTRSVIGSTSMRVLVGGPGWRPTSYSITDIRPSPPSRPRAVSLRRTPHFDDDVPVAVDVGPSPGGITVVESYWLTMAGPGAGPRQELLAVVARSTGFSSPSTRNHASPSCVSACSGDSVPCSTSGLERGHEPDAPDADVRQLDVRPRSGASTRARGCRGSRRAPSRSSRGRSRRRDVDAQLVALAQVAAVADPLEDDLVGGQAVRLELGARLLLQLFEGALHRRRVELERRW